MSAAVVLYMEKIHSIVRQITAEVQWMTLMTADVNNAFWRVCMNVTLQVAVYLGRDCLKNLRFTGNQLLKSVKQFFHVTGRLIGEQAEISVWPRLTTNSQPGDQ